jgi:uncharacterized membrane protein
MIIVNLDKQGINGHIILKPDLSLGWHANILAFIVFSVFTLIVAFYFTFFGKWQVLPFSGLELIAFLAALYIFFNRFTYREVILFSLDKITIEYGKKSAEESKTYMRLWSKFHIEHTNNRDIPKVFIRSNEQESEIGQFLSYKDKTEFIKTLKNITLKFNNLNL